MAVFPHLDHPELGADEAHEKKCSLLNLASDIWYWGKMIIIEHSPMFRGSPSIQTDISMSKNSATKVAVSNLPIPFWISKELQDQLKFWETVWTGLFIRTHQFPSCVFYYTLHVAFMRKDNYKQKRSLLPWLCYQGSPKLFIAFCLSWSKTRHSEEKLTDALSAWKTCVLDRTWLWLSLQVLQMI